MRARPLEVPAEPLFVAITRPAMRWGVTYTALLVNVVVTMEVFLVTKNLLVLLMCVPVHGISALLCARDARCFDLLFLWGRTRLPALWANARFWKASAYSALCFECGRSARRRATPVARV